ncbi:MAG: methylenetetrahydrofolate reductase [NAD(P)H] [Gemmataceae bacterium]|nr:methylenetetrahydrofolate reductase [NAD(P)H] [Gemmataceae bacterium]
MPGQRPVISFEFFPPKDAAAEATLLRDTVPALKRLGPSFISVTYGAGGSTRGTTLRVVASVRQDHGIEAVSHLTCVGSTREMLLSLLEETTSLGIQNLLALRGDPPKGETAFRPVEGGFAYAVDLIRFLRERGDYSIGAACYPEGHVECGDRRLDWDRAAAKVEAGAEFLITQLFYDWRDFLEMEDYLRNRRGVKVPIVPGILPFLNTRQIKRFTSLCGARLPPPILETLDRYADDDASVRQYGIEVATDLCAQAIRHGMAGIHFYCLNRVSSCQAIVENLGLAKRDADAEVA